MQPFIGPPIPIHLLATTSGTAHTIVLITVAVSLTAHVAFLLWCFWFFRRWRREIWQLSLQPVAVGADDGGNDIV